MAEGLTVDGLPLRVKKNTWRELSSLYQGGRARTRLNTLVSTEDATTRMRVFECEVYFISAAEESTARSACPIGEAVTLAGELPDATLSALVDLGQTTKLRTIENGVQVLHRVAALHIEQAG